MKKILFVIGTLSSGGAERVVSVLAEELSRKGYDIGITTVYNNKNDYISNKNIKLISIKHRFRNRVFRALEIIIGLRNIIRREKSDIIISFVWQVNIYTILSNLFMKKKLIVSERNDPYHDPQNRYLARIRDFLYRFCNGFVFQTKNARMYFAARIQKKSVIISNPIKIDLPFWNEKESEKTIITACRLTKQKNLPLLFEAFKNLLNEFPDYQLKIFGNGELHEQLSEKISAMDLSKKIQLVGFSNNIHNEMASASLFVMSSDYEGVSNSMLEALAIGVPVISTDSPTGGARMFIKSGKNGILTEVGNCNELTMAIKHILSDKKHAIRISYEARKIREKLAPQKIAEKWIEYIDGICGGKDA